MFATVPNSFQVLDTVSCTKRVSLPRYSIPLPCSVHSVKGAAYVEQYVQSYSVESTLVGLHRTRSPYTQCKPAQRRRTDRTDQYWRSRYGFPVQQRTGALGLIRYVPYRDVPRSVPRYGPSARIPKYYYGYNFFFVQVKKNCYVYLQACCIHSTYLEMQCVRRYVFIKKLIHLCLTLFILRGHSSIAESTLLLFFYIM